MKKISKYLLSLAILSFMVLPVMTLTANAQVVTNTQTSEANTLFGLDPVNVGLDGTLQDGDPRTMVGSIINVALGFLGVIAVVIILMGGFKWMTAGGNEEKVSEAKKLLGAGVIGLAIVLAAWAVSTFVIEAIYTATQAA